MFKLLIINFVIFSSLFANIVKEDKWPLGETFLTFLEKYQIPQKLYFDLEKEDKELCSEITAGNYYYLMENDDKSLNQVLIPVSEEIQLHLYKEADGTYKFETPPISYREFTETISMPITSNVSEQLQEATGSAALAANLKAVFSDVSFRRMQKGDFIVIEYTQKELLGRHFGQPEIKSAMVEVSGKKYYRFKNDGDDKYYDETGKAFTKFYFFKIPLSYRRISSIFTQKRWHPVLKRYRAHLGTDFAAPRGTRIYAAGVVDATSFGIYLLLFKLINIYLFGFWLVIHNHDVKTKDMKFTKLKFGFYTIIYIIFLAEIIIELTMFSSIEVDKLVSCCGTLYSNSSGSYLSSLYTFDNSVVVSVFYGVYGLLLLFYFIKNDYLFVIINLLFLIVSLLSLIMFFGTYVYELPTHHCPFCMLQKEYNYVGYIMYLFLFLGTFYGFVIPIKNQILKTFDENKKYYNYSIIFSSIYTLIVTLYPVIYYMKNGVWL